MSTSPHTISPTETAASGLRDQREHSLNSFTAVNGRGSPPQSTSRASEGAMNARPVTADGQSRPQVATNGEGSYHHHHMSPLNGPTKRKRSVEEGDDDISDEEDDSLSPEDTTQNVEYGQASDENANTGDASWNGRTQIDSDDVQIVEALRREPHTNGHSQIDSGGPVVPANNHNEYVTTSANVKVDPKKRKRAFTNRTKTGCTTCRKRKKKCDEGKPTCSNCERGGFICEGYTQRSTFPKTAAPKQHPTPIQSKDSFVDHGGLQARPPRPNSYPDSHPPTVPEVVRRTPQQPQPVVIDDDLSGRPVSNEWAPPMYGAGPTSRGYGMNRYASDVPPGPFRTHLDRPSSSIPAPPSSTMSGVNGIPYDMHPSTVAIAQQGLQQIPNVPTAPINSVSPSDIEKNNMKHGRMFNQLDPHLVADRDKCKQSLSRFNKGAADGVSADERDRQLRHIIEPDGQSQHPSRVGKNVVVEAPFRCDYGYSLNLRDNVWIEAGCVITDAAEVKICQDVHIGPDVKILSRVEPERPEEWMPPNRPPGTKMARGIRIIIAERVKIGAGAIIAPVWETKGGDNSQFSIGIGAHILPGSIVRKSVPAYTVHGYKDIDGPDVIRGVAGADKYDYQHPIIGPPMAMYDGRIP